MKQEKGIRKPIPYVLLALWVPFVVSSGLAADMDEFKVKREEVFGFAQKPQVTRDGDKVTITFETKGFCDVAIAVENADGKMLRHVVSGVLGPNAPTPLQKNSKKQTVVWDGKDDQGKYIDDKDACTVRVSLGLKPRFERNLFHTPYKLWGRNQPVIAPAPEGVYVFEGDNVDSVKLFDHEGTYVRTVYPFPADKIEQVKGLRWRQAPQDGAKVPLKEGFYQSTFFNSGYNSGFDKASGYGTTHFPTIGHYWAEDAPDFPAATAFIVRGKHIALAGPLGINRMTTDGSTGGMDLIGPRFRIKAFKKGMYGRKSLVRVSPRAAALSPDGKWLYLTGYRTLDESKYGYCGRRWLHAVLRVRLDDQTGPKVFVGTTQPDAKGGSGPDQLNSPVSLACDGQGNVYVADYGNNRIQIFAPDGKLTESINIARPAHVAVHHKTGELYVFSWLLKIHAPDPTGDAVLVRLGPPGKREKIASYALPFNGYRPKFRMYHELGGVQYRAELDPWTEPPTVWLVPGAVWQPANAGDRDCSWPRGAIKVAVIDGDKLTVKKDFGKETLKSTVRDAPAANSRQLLVFNSKTGRLYVFEPRVSADQAVEIDPETGKGRLVDLPHTADEICFDMDGLIYLRAPTVVTRYNTKTWREVPWDYGEKRQAVGGAHGRSVNVISGLVLPGAHPSEPSSTCCGGFSISPKGYLVAQCWNGEAFSAGTDRRKQKGIAPVGRRYMPKLYPGRQRWGEIHVWDKHGKVVYKDATPGITMTDGVAMDAEDNLYVFTNPARTPDGKRVLNPKTETLIKFKPGKGKVITSGDRAVRGSEGVRIPVLLGKGKGPDGPSQIAGRHQPAAWVQGAEWLYGGGGFSSGGDTCWNARCALDLYARTFAPEPDRFTVAVLDTNGNLIMRIGKYGNLDDGKPLVPDPVIKQTRSIGGDEVALMHACYVGVQSDKRLFISDAGNRRIASVKLGYHVEERVALKDVPDPRET